MLDALLLFILPAFLAYAAVSDMLTMTISNRLCAAIALSFFAVALVAGLSWPAIGMHVLASFAMLAVTFGMFAAGWMGGGDAKLAAATALWFGFGGLLNYVVVASIAGGVLTLVILAARGLPVPAVAERWPWYQRLHNAKSGIPYGIALAAGG
jgi:prepilin peptidase CpaA